MKKFCALISLIMVLCILFSACGNANNSKKLENVKAALVGGTFEGGSEFYTRTYSFKVDGTYYGTHTGHFAGMSGGTTSNSGTYEITESAIILTQKDGSITELTYTYNSDNGKLVLYFNSDALTK